MENFQELPSHTEPDPARYTAIRLGMAPDTVISSGPPIKGGMKSTGTANSRLEDSDVAESETQGGRAVYLVVRKSDQGDETPVFRVTEGVADAVCVFSKRELAVLYLQIANWEGYRVRQLSPVELSQWVLSLEGDHVKYLLVDANRHHQIHGRDPGHVVDIGAMRDLSGENLFQEIHSVAIS